MELINQIATLIEPKQGLRQEQEVSDYDAGLIFIGDVEETLLAKEVSYCQICSKIFPKKQALLTHVQCFHSKQDCKLDKINRIDKNCENKCELCDKFFCTKNYLKQHIETIHEKQKNFQCHICKRCFSQSGSLKKHMDKIHDKLPTHKCEDCSRKFALKRDLKRHMNLAH